MRPGCSIAAARLITWSASRPPPARQKNWPRYHASADPAPRFTQSACCRLKPDLAVGWIRGTGRRTWTGWTALASRCFAATDGPWRISPRQSGRSVDLPALGAVADRAADAFVLGLRTLAFRHPPRPAYVVVWGNNRRWPSAAATGINDAHAAGFQNQFAAHDAGCICDRAEAMLAAAGGAQRIALMPSHRPCRRRIADLLSRPGPSCHARCSCCANCARYPGRLALTRRRNYPPSRCPGKKYQCFVKLVH